MLPSAEEELVVAAIAEQLQDVFETEGQELSLEDREHP